MVKQVNVKVLHICHFLHPLTWLLSLEGNTVHEMASQQLAETENLKIYKKYILATHSSAALLKLFRRKQLMSIK